MRRRLIALLALLVAASPVAALAASTDVADLKGGTYVLDPKHTHVTARVLHFGVAYFLVRFDTKTGTFTYDPDHPEAAHVEASVDTGSLDANGDFSSKFAEEFLAATKFPKMTFVSTEIHKGAGGAGTMTGNLTLRGVTRPVTFDVAFVGVGRNPLPPFNAIAGFTATVKIKRSDFGSDFLNNGLVGDEVAITIDAEFDRK